MKNKNRLFAAIGWVLILAIQPALGQPAGVAETQHVDKEYKGYMQENVLIPVNDFETATIKISNKQVVIDGYWEFKDESGRVLEEPVILSQPASLTDKMLLALRRPGRATVSVTEGGETKVYSIKVDVRFEENNMEKELESAILEFVKDPGLRVKVLPPQAALVGANLNRAFGEESASEILAPRGQTAGNTTGEITTASDFRPTIILEGTVKNDLVVTKAENIARAYTVNVINLMNIAEPIQIRINVKVVQVSKSEDSQIGIQHRGASTDVDGNALSGLGLIFTSTAPFFETGANNQLPIFGDLFTGSGTYRTEVNLNKLGVKVKVLQEPTLTVLNGQPAQFVVGQTFFVPVSTFSDNGVIVQDFEERNIGVSLRLTPMVEEEETFRVDQSGLLPFSSITAQKSGTERNVLGGSDANNNDTVNTVDENGVIRLTVQPMVSTLDSIDARGFPVINVNHVETRVALRHHESLVLGGLFDDTQRKTMQSVPFLSDIPILGELFKNRVHDNDRHELVFVLTPEILGLDDVKEKGTYHPQDDDMRDSMLSEGISTKPTRISANDVSVRKSEGVSFISTSSQPIYLNVDPSAEKKEVVPASSQKEGVREIMPRGVEE